MKPEFIPKGPAIVIEEDDRRILVVADTHFGAESELKRRGVHIMSNTPERLLRLLECIEVSGADLLLLLGDVKHSVPVTSWQEMKEMPDILTAIRSKIDLKVLPGNHDAGIERFLRDDEILPRNGVMINKTGYMHGHTFPSTDITGGLIIAGHHHPVVNLYDDVGCFMRGAPAFVLAEIDDGSMNMKDCRPGTRVLFVPAFFELAGGMDVCELKKSGLSPLSRCIIEDTADVFLADGTYINTIGGISADKSD
ncbi:MAG: metallophosphoesterase [Methanomicrobiaceae archaeon]|nr:metallophosphoesterase [Methanomicrobiaceae archaeon]